MGDVLELGPRGESPAEEGQTCSLVSGFGIARWGTALRWGTEVPVGREGVGKCRSWGGDGEKKKEDVSEVSWSAGAERGLAAALQGCREGSGGDVGALGEGLRAVCWWVWGCFHPVCSQEALASFARCR